MSGLTVECIVRSNNACKKKKTKPARDLYTKLALFIKIQTRLVNVAFKLNALDSLNKMII